MKNLKRSILALLFVHSFVALSHLRSIYNINNAQNISFVRCYHEYEDVLPYGNHPSCLNLADLMTLNSTFDWNNHLSYQIKNPKQLYVAKINNAFISPSRLGTIFDNNQQLLFGLYLNPSAGIFWPIDSGTQGKSRLNYKKLATVQGPTFFYHWLIDRMPSLFMLKKHILDNPDMMLVVSAIHGIPQYVYEYLELLGIPGHQIIPANMDKIYYADEVYFATPFLMEPIPHTLLLEMRNSLITAAQQKRTTREYKNNLIVVIQRQESDRRIANFTELLDCVKQVFNKDDYEILVFNGNGSVSEQIAIFNNAKLIIGVMASGLANVIYANPGASVIEIHPTLPNLVDSNGVNNYGAEWCWWLSSAVGLDYWVLPTPFRLSDARVTCPIDGMKKILAEIANKMK